LLLCSTSPVRKGFFGAAVDFLFSCMLVLLPSHGSGKATQCKTTL